MLINRGLECAFCVVVEVRLLQGSFEFEYGGRASSVVEEQEAGSRIPDAASKGGSSALD